MRGREAGFTLLELLVGLVVLGFILAGLSQGARLGLRAGTVQAGLSDTLGDLDAVDRTVRELIGAAEPGSLQRGPPMRGTAGRVEFDTMLPAAAAVQRHASVALGVDAAHRLVLRWTPDEHALPLGPPATPDEAELLRGVDHLVVSYWQDGWRESWEGKVLPGLVRLRIVFLTGDKRHWPDIVAATRRQPVRQGG